MLDYLTSDVDRIVNFFPSVQEIWSMPLQILIAISLLYMQLGLASFAGIGFIIVLIPINKLLANKIGFYSSRFMENKDGRMKIVIEYLKSIITVKVGCFESLYSKWISRKRKKELHFLKCQKYLDAFCVLFWSISPVVICTLTFTLYVLLGNQITSAKILTSLALFNLLIGPMNSLPWVINGLVEASISLRRIRRIQSNMQNTNNSTSPIRSPQVTSYQPIRHENEIYDDMIGNEADVNILVELKNACFNWSNNSTNEDALTDINMSISENDYIGITGDVGSGKTSFLLALMGELVRTDGHYKLASSLVNASWGYVGQKTWLVNRSIRDNIILYAQYDPVWYRKVVQACCLDLDFEYMQNSDQTIIADHGVSLSGGQKARICLARAIYRRHSIYLLDDPLSSLDGRVGRAITKNVIGGLLKDCTVIMATHSCQYFKKFDVNIRVPDKVFRIDRGKLARINTAVQQFSINTDLIDINGDFEPDVKIEEDEIEEQTSTSTHYQLIEESEDTKSLISMELKENDEHMEEGFIKKKVYFGYIKLVGYLMSSVVFFSLILMQGSKNFSEYWLSIWSSSNTTNKSHPSPPNMTIYPIYAPLTPFTLYFPSQSDNPILFYLSVYLIIVAVNFTFSVTRAFSFAYGGIQASYRMHRGLLTTLLNAPLKFFEQTPRGRIINRLSSDLATVDDGLPFIFNIFLANCVVCLGSIVIVCISLPFVFIVLIPICWYCFVVQVVYRSTSRAVKRLISVTRSPFYSHISELLEQAGLVTIRSVGRELHDIVLCETGNLLGKLIRVEYSGMVLSCWLGLRLQIMGILFVTVVIGVSLGVSSLDLIQNSLIGLACVYTFSLSSNLSNVITSGTETEKEFIAVERCFEYFPVTKSESVSNDLETQSQGQNGIVLENQWEHPSLLAQSMNTGFSVEFSNVNLRYGKFENLALDNLNFQIPRGENLGIIGRTGSGKSSLLKVLFRLMNFEENLVENKVLCGYNGKIFINKRDSRSYKLSELRSQISAMMQDSVVFPDTLRNNMDPFNKFCDDEIQTTATQLHLSHYFPNLVKSPNRTSDGILLFDLDSLVTSQSIQIDKTEDKNHENAENSNNELSFGQYQLICLARLVLMSRDKDIVCLDEPSAFVDSFTESIIEAVIVEEFKSKSTILIGHRLGMLKRVCDWIMVLDKGKIIEFGRVNELLANSQSEFSKRVSQEKQD